MLFTENELYSINPLSILDECMYLGYDESLVNPITIPIKENTRLGYNIVRFDDVYTLSESYGIDYIDAMYSIAENNNIDPNDLAVSVPEEDIIAYPELVNELANIVIEPISTNDIEYRLCEECINSWIDTGNEEYIEILEATPGDLAVDANAYVRAAYGDENLPDAKEMREIERRLASSQQRAEGYKKAYEGSLSDISHARGQARSQTQRADDVTWGLNQATKEGLGHKARADAAEAKVSDLQNALYDMKTRATDAENVRDDYQKHLKNANARIDLLKRLAAENDRAADDYKKQTDAKIDTLTRLAAENDRAVNEYKNKRLHRYADKLYSAGNWVKNNKVKTGLGVAAGAAVLGGGILAYKKYRNAPKSVIGKRIASLRNIYRKYMLSAQKNPSKAGLFKKIAAKILSVIDHLMGYLQRKAG